MEEKNRRKTSESRYRGTEDRNKRCDKDRRDKNISKVSKLENVV